MRWIYSFNYEVSRKEMEEGIYSRGSIQVRSIGENVSQPTVMDSTIIPYMPRDIRIQTIGSEQVISGTGDINSTIELVQSDGTSLNPIISTIVDEWGDFRLVTNSLPDNSRLSMSKNNLVTSIPLPSVQLPEVNYSLNDNNQVLMTISHSNNVYYTTDAGITWIQYEGEVTLDGLYPAGSIRAISIDGDNISASTIAPGVISPYTILVDSITVRDMNYLIVGRTQPDTIITVDKPILEDEVRSDDYGQFSLEVLAQEMSEPIPINLEVYSTLGTVNVEVELPINNSPSGYVTVHLQIGRLNIWIDATNVHLKNNRSIIEVNDNPYQLELSNDSYHVYVNNIDTGYLPIPYIATASTYKIISDQESCNINVTVPPQFIDGSIVAIRWNDESIPSLSAVYQGELVTIQYPSLPVSNDHQFYVVVSGGDITESNPHDVVVIEAHQDVLRTVLDNNQLTMELGVGAWEEYITGYNGINSITISIHNIMVRLESPMSGDPVIDSLLDSMKNNIYNKVIDDNNIELDSLNDSYQYGIVTLINDISNITDIVRALIDIEIINYEEYGITFQIDGYSIDIDVEVEIEVEPGHNVILYYSRDDMEISI